MMVKGKKVFVGVSGGVDSSVSAALLKEAGYDVTGVFIRVWKPEYADKNKVCLGVKSDCSEKDDRLDAMRVCAKLGIPFETLDLEDEYKKDVVDYMISEYKSGRTPNPDVMCNKYIKFGGFFDYAMKNGADYVATGHYAKADNGNLIAGKDKNKDQSYFLWTLTKEQLQKTLFPIGDIDKPEVRKLAEKFDLITATKKDSQGLCFMGKIDAKEFLKKYIEEERGNVLNEKGEVIGHHDGIFYFTIGERRGFYIDKKSPNDKPYYIISKSIKDNILVVSQDVSLVDSDEKEKVILKDTIIRAAIDESKKYQARIRYRQPLEPCSIVKSKKLKVESEEGEIELCFDNAQKAVTPGQSAVIYDGEVCIGGGIIV